MSYRINHYNGSLIAVVNDGTVDNTLDITLVGKNYAGYGTIQNDNFVYLLENFANTIPPANPISGQVWFDSGNKKLKFYDGSTFRTTGGAEIGANEPSGLTVGDFWWDTANNQLHAYTGNGFTLIGPQVAAGSGTTEMLTTSVRDTDGTVHSIIQAISSGETAFVISSDSDYTLDDTLNAIPGFTTIHKGVTLAYTDSDVYTGVTIADNRFWGTATNSDRLGGKDASNFVQSGDASFDSIVNFADVGYTVGTSTPKLRVYNNAATTPTFSNIAGDTMVFTTTVSSTTATSMILKGADILPGTSGTTNLGSSSSAFNTVYGSTFTGTAAKSQLMRISSTNNYTGTEYTAVANSIPVRDSNADLFARKFQGTAVAAQYADLAEKYLPDQEYEVGTVVAIGGSAEITCAAFGMDAIGVISDKPAYLMNKDLVGGLPVALKGRVPVKVIGPVKKGDSLISAGAGYGRADNECAGPRRFAIALESDNGDGVRLIECLVL
jgi:hypothetical protein